MHNPNQYKPIPCGVMAGWERVGNEPVFGGAMGTVFDNYVIYEDGIYKMWYSWRHALYMRKAQMGEIGHFPRWF